MGDTTSGQHNDRLWQPVTARWFGVLTGGALGYAIIRYHIFGGVEWAHFPLFILNKALSLAAVFFVASSYLVGRVIKWHNAVPGRRLVVVKFCGLMGFSLAGVHVFFSVALLNSAYYPGFFQDSGRLNVYGELGIAAGVIALWALTMPAITTLPMMPKAIGGFRWKRNQRMGYLALALVAVHMVAFGVRGWLAPENWNGGLPPISLLALVAALVPLGVKLVRIESKG